MSPNHQPPHESRPHRRRADDIVREKPDGGREAIESLPPEEARRLVHELRTREIELDLQN